MTTPSSSCSLKGKKKPCGNCPWRKDAPLHEWTVEKWLHLAMTCQGDEHQTMACHKSTEGNDIPCAGYVVQMGIDNSVGIRLLACLGQLNPDEYSADGLDLYEDFQEILDAHGIEFQHPNPWWRRIIAERKAERERRQAGGAGRARRRHPGGRRRADPGDRRADGPEGAGDPEDT